MEVTPGINIRLKGVSPMVQEETQHQPVGLLGLDCLGCKVRAHHSNRKG